MLLFCCFFIIFHWKFYPYIPWQTQLLTPNKDSRQHFLKLKKTSLITIFKTVYTYMYGFFQTWRSPNCLQKCERCTEARQNHCRSDMHSLRCRCWLHCVQAFHRMYPQRFADITHIKLIWNKIVLNFKDDLFELWNKIQFVCVLPGYLVKISLLCHCLTATAAKKLCRDYYLVLNSKQVC